MLFVVPLIRSGFDGDDILALFITELVLCDGFKGQAILSLKLLKDDGVLNEVLMKGSYLVRGEV